MHGETGHVVFRPDHTRVDLFPDWELLHGRMYTTATGVWRVEGDTVFSEVQPLSLPGSPELPKRAAKMTLPDTREAPLRMKNAGHSDLVRASTIATRYTQVLLALCAAASLTLLLAFSHAARRSALGGAFTLLALGAASVLFYLLLHFVEELAQTGDVITSFQFLRSLRLPCELLKIAAATLFMIGSLRMIRQLKSLSIDKRI